jgi:hypothetical protein
MVTYAESKQSEEARKAYDREKSRRYRERNREKIRAAQAARVAAMGKDAYCEYQKQWQAKNPDKVKQYRENGDPEKRSSRYKRHYEKNKRKKNDFRVSLRHKHLEQKATRPRPETCEVCGSPPVRGHKVLCWDHCHATGEFRGWLCASCNNALGMAKDDPAILRKLADYLEGKLPWT